MMERSMFLLLSATLLLPASVSLAAPAAMNASVSKAVVAASTAAQAATAKLTKDAAYQMALTYAKLPEGMKLDNTYFRSGDTWRSFPEWSFSWNSKKTNDDNSLYISVSVDANTGSLTSYTRNGGVQDSAASGSKISREAALAKADWFLKQANSQKSTLVQLYDRDLAQQKPPLGIAVSYNFHFVRYVDGIPFPENGADIRVDGNGNIISYLLTWTDSVKFEQQKGLLDEKAALNAYKVNTKAKMSFGLPWENQNQDNPTPSLIYRNPFQNYLDPVSGKLVTPSLQPVKATELEAVSTGKLSSLHTGKPLTQEEALAFAEKTLPISGYQLINANYNESSQRGNRPIWNLQMEKKQKSNERFAYCEIDAVTGDILSFSNDSQPFRQEKEGTVSKKQAERLKKSAMETLRKWSPTLASDLYYSEAESGNSGKMPGNSSSSYFQFQRYVKGIPAASGSASVTINNITGEVTSYYVNIGSESYPKQLPEHISADEALDAWLKEAQPELVYVMEPVNEADLTWKGTSDTNRNVQLVYRMSTTPSDEPYDLDASSGGWISQSTGKPYTLHREKPTDIAGIPAEQALMLMYQYDAIQVKDGKLMPELSITRGEMIDMLIITLNQGKISPMMYEQRAASYSDVAKTSNYFASVENAVDRGLLDKNSKNLNPDQKITRAELADMLVRALGYRQLAGHSEMFTSALTDIANSKLRGPIIIINSLGIMPAEQNLFKPDEQVSRADAALAFSRFLEKRAELVEKQSVNRY